MPSSYVTSGQLAAMIGKSRESIRRYEALGYIPAGLRDPINNRRYWTLEQAEEIAKLLHPVEPD